MADQYVDMGDLRGVGISEGKVGSNVAVDGREFAIVLQGVATSGLPLKEVKTIRRPADAVALGIDAQYDLNNHVNVYRHISEFYRMAGEGKTLHIMLLAIGGSFAEMIDMMPAFNEVGDNISDYAFTKNVADAVNETMINGITEDLYNSIPKLQLFAENLALIDRPAHIIVEGRNISQDLGSCINLRDFQIDNNVLSAHKVSVVCGQDWNYADGLGNENMKKFADVGNFLGVIASQSWNRNPGEVETQNLTKVAAKIFTVGGLSNHKKFSDVMAQLPSLNEKGYIFPIRYAQTTGYWWNDGHVCAPIIVDAEGNLNQHTIYYSHTIDMSIRALRLALLPEVKKVVVLEENGKMGQDLIDLYAGIGDKAFKSLQNKSLISKGKTYINPESDLLVAKELLCGFSVIPTGCVGKITGTINLKTSL